MRMLIDFETFSVAPITAGPNRYAADDHAGAWCASWGVKAPGATLYTGPFITIFDGGQAGIPAVEEELRRGGYAVAPRSAFFAAVHSASTFVAHNTPFEAAILRWVFGLEIPSERWSCTLARSTRLGLPPALEWALIVLRAPVKKDMTGNALSKKMGKPKAFGADGRPVWFDDFGSVVRVAEYCVTDFYGEAWLDDTLPELEPEEFGRWCRQKDENDRGILVDWDLVAKGRAVTEFVISAAARVLPQWTGGAVAEITSATALLKWVRRRGMQVDSLGAETLDLLLDATPDLPEDVREVLSVRRAVRTSSAKLEALRERRMPAKCGPIADRVCDLTQWGGARTLRTVGRGFQPLNLPRAGDVDVDTALEALRRMDMALMCGAVGKEARKRKPTDKAGVRTYKTAAEFVAPSECVASTLRATLKATVGTRFCAADYTGVEFRATLALAGQMDALKLLKDGADLYCELATAIYLYEVLKKEHPEERQLGKQGCLGCGFGLSNPKTFQATCAQYGLYISEELADKVIKTFAKRFNAVPPLWFAIHSAAKRAMNNPGTWQGDPRYGVQYQYIHNGLAGISWLQCWLPSGRMMYYPGARMVEGPYGPAISVMSWKNGQWVSQILSRQVTIENVIQAICRDIMENDKRDLLASGRCKIVLTIYDEVVAEFSEAECQRLAADGKTPEPLAWMLEMMTRPVEWFPMFPRAAEGWCGPHYKKG